MHRWWTLTPRAALLIAATFNKKSFWGGLLVIGVRMISYSDHSRDTAFEEVWPDYYLQVGLSADSGRMTHKQEVGTCTSASTRPTQEIERPSAVRR